MQTREEYPRPDHGDWGAVRAAGDGATSEYTYVHPLPDYEVKVQ